MKHHTCQVALVSAAVVFLSAVIGPGVSSAATDGTPRFDAVTVVEPPQPEMAYRIAATLRDADGVAISGEEITFSATVDLVGERQVLLGSAMTNATGTARVPIAPRKPEYLVAVTFAGSEEHEPAETIQEVVFPEEAVEPLEPLVSSTALLAPIRDVMPSVITVVVIALWLALGALGLWALRRIRHPDVLSTQHHQEGAP